jgi:oleate hydratase
MPYITAFFLPRREGDRPKVVPQHAVNFGFLGQFAETPRDVIFTIEYSVRTAMEAVYMLLDIERGVPEPWGSQYDIRALLNSTAVLRDGERLKLPAFIAEALERTDLGDLLRQYGLIGQVHLADEVAAGMRPDLDSVDDKVDEDAVTVAVFKTPPRSREVL